MRSRANIGQLPTPVSHPPQLFQRAGSPPQNSDRLFRCPLYRPASPLPPGVVPCGCWVQWPSIFMTPCIATPGSLPWQQPLQLFRGSGPSSSGRPTFELPALSYLSGPPPRSCFRGLLSLSSLAPSLAIDCCPALPPCSCFRGRLSLSSLAPSLAIDCCPALPSLQLFEEVGTDLAQALTQKEHVAQIKAAMSSNVAKALSRVSGAAPAPRCPTLVGRRAEGPPFCWTCVAQDSARVFLAGASLAEAFGRRVGGAGQEWGGGHLPQDPAERGCILAHYSLLASFREPPWHGYPSF